VLRLAIDIGADVEKNCGFAGGRGKHCRQCRPIDAGQRSQNHFGRGHSRAGVSGSDESSGASFAHQAQAHAHGGITLAAHCIGSLLAHADYFSGMNDINGKTTNGRVLVDFAVQFFANLGFAPHQQDANIMMAAGKNCPFHFGLGSPVGTHRIDCDYGWHSEKGDCKSSGGMLTFRALTLKACSPFPSRKSRGLCSVHIWDRRGVAFSFRGSWDTQRASAE
jgi:hypothetical protein